MKRSRNQNKPPAAYNLVLEEVVGLTTKNGNGLASSISSSKFAYIAGCVVVLHDVHSGIQSHLVAPKRVPKPLSCVALSCDASIAAAGESGHQPGVLVWDSANLALVCELKGHQYGVSCIALSPDGKHLVSVGFPRDGCICFWDWRNKILAAKVKASGFSCPIASIEFSLDNKFVVIAEKNQLKFWKVRWSLGSRASTRSTSVTLQRKFDLGCLKDSSFIAVTSLSQMDSSLVNHIQAGEQIPFYAVTEKGMLCLVYPDSSVIINSVKLEVARCFALSASTSLVACACNNGLVKLFDAKSLEYAGQLLYVEAKRFKESTVVDYKMDINKVEHQNGPTFPDAIACQFSTPEKLVVVYDDHSLYIWNIWNVQKVHEATRCCVLISHSGCIWDIKNIPCEYMHDPSLSCVAKGCDGGLSFATCSADGSIRLWDLALKFELSENSYSHPQVDSSNADKCLVSAGIFERDSVAQGISSPGFRSMAVSSDGKHVAAGDCQGNIHIFNLHTSDYFCIKDACGAEILSLSFNMADNNDVSPTEALESRLLLASGGRDGRIYLFDVARNFHLLGSIEYHSSAVSVVKVAQRGHQILSCGADRFLVLHSLDVSSTECKFSCLQSIGTGGTIIDMAVDHSMDVAFTVGQDKKISAFDIQSGKLIKWFKHDGDADAGDPVKVAIDGSCSYVACSYSNRCVCIYDYITGKVVARGAGHSKVITGIIFLSDCKHLVSVGADGCIFVWKLPTSMSSRMLHRTKKLSLHCQPESESQPNICNLIKPYSVADQQWRNNRKEASVNENLNQIHEGMFLREGNSPAKAGFKFSISRLPKWARCKAINNSLHADIDSRSSQVGSYQNYECFESESPSKDPVEGGQQFSGTFSRQLPHTESSRVSPNSSETYSWGIDNRWLTIHTVCMDLLDSPQTFDMKGLNVQRTEKDSTPRGQPMETTHCNKRIKLTSLDSCTRDLPAEPNSGKHNHLWLSNSSFSQGTEKDDTSRKDSQENKNYKKKSDNLSAQLKNGDKTGSPSRFLVERELLEGRKNSLSIHAEDSIGASLRETKKSDYNILPMESSTSVLEERYSTEDAGNEPPSPCRQLDPDKVEVEAVRSCKEALHNLEAAAENALQSFSNLAAINAGEDESSSVAKAATRFQSIEKKIQAIGKLLQPASNLQRER